jgi:uncharacterized protein (UPF0147 family)
MELTTNRLTEQQEALVRAISSGLTMREASEASGYSVTNTYNALSSPIVRAAIQTSLSNMLQTRAAPMALHVLIEITEDKTAPKGVRVDAARTLLDRAGYVAPRAREATKDEKPLSERTPEELRAFIAQLESTLADKAKPVHGTRVDDTTDAQVSDMFD